MRQNMDIIWNVFELLMSLIQSIIVTIFIIRYFEYKDMKNKIFFAVILVILLFVVTTLNNIFIPGYEGFAGFFYIIITFIYALIFLKGSALEKLFIVMLEYGILFMLSILIIPTISYIFSADINEALTMERSWIRFFTIIIGIAIYYFLLELIIFSKKENNELKPKQWIFVFLVPFASGILMIAMFEVKINEKSGNLYIFFSVISILMILALNFIIYYIISELTRNNKLETEYKLFKQSKIYEEKNIEDIQRIYDTARIIRHDVKHRDEYILSELQNIPEITEKQIQSIEKIKKYINNTGEQMADIDYKILTGNSVIDNIINYKISVAQKYNIEVIYYIENSQIEIPEIDISRILGNLLDNAIEACNKTNMSEKSIKIMIYKRKVYRCISVSNTIDKSILETNQNLRSTKKEKDMHGFGIKSIRSIVEKYDGFLNYYEENNRIFFEILLAETDLSQIIK